MLNFMFGHILGIGSLLGGIWAIRGYMQPTLQYKGERYVLRQTVVWFALSGFTFAVLGILYAALCLTPEAKPILMGCFVFILLHGAALCYKRNALIKRMWVYRAARTLLLAGYLSMALMGVAAAYVKV